MEKQCTKCFIIKPLSDFHMKPRRTDGRSSWCKICSRAAIKAQYNNRKEYYQEEARKRNKLRREYNRKQMAIYFQTHACVDCGEADLRCLQFDHLKDKRQNISSMMSQNSWEDILCEIAKCEVRCANCHAKRTSKQFGWWKNASVA